MKALVTGANGFVGQTLCVNLEATEHVTVRAAAGRAKVERNYTIQVNVPRLAALLRAAAG